MKIGEKKRSTEELYKFRKSYKEFWNNKLNNVVITQLLDGKVYLNEIGFWCKKCPNCKNEIQYSRKDNAIASANIDAFCINCAALKKGKKIKKKTSVVKVFENVEGVYFCERKLWCRKCPQCNNEIEYTSRYCSITAQKNKSICYGCYSTALESPKERSFLDYFNIIDRQVPVGPYIVDGIKGKVIYEFLGDFWHGNPDRFELNATNKTTGKTFKTLYVDTVRRFKVLKKMGYEVKYIWESDWNVFENDRLLDNSKFRYFNDVDLLT